MAFFKYDLFVKKVNNTCFDETHQPGDTAPYAGIYRCLTCSHEIAIAGGHILPPENSHTHPLSKGPIKWRLTVAADHMAK